MYSFEINANIVAFTLILSFGFVFAVMICDAIADERMKRENRNIVREREAREFARVLAVRNTFTNNTIR